MKKKLSMIFAAMISMGLLADQRVTNAVAPAETPAGSAVTSPAAEPAKPAATAEKPARRRTPARKPVQELRTVPLNPGPAVVSVSSSSRVMVRGRPGFVGEIVARLTNGEPVTVIEEVPLKHSKADEPSVWAKIALPAQAHAWVNTPYIDVTNNSVKPKTLNVRAGPGENYSQIGTLHRGDVVQEVQRKGEWMEIPAPTNAYAFIAAAYLSQDPVVLAAAVPPEPALVAETPAVAPAPTEPPPVAETPAAPAPEPPAVEPAPAIEEPPPPRIVQREGIVRGTVSIQAPTRYALVSTDNGRTINYLYSTSTNLDLSRYKGLHLIVSGEESLDERWKTTPVITIQRIVVLE